MYQRCEFSYIIKFVCCTCARLEASEPWKLTRVHQKSWMISVGLLVDAVS